MVAIVGLDLAVLVTLGFVTGGATGWDSGRAVFRVGGVETLETVPPGIGTAPVELVAESYEVAGGRLKAVGLDVEELATCVLSEKAVANKFTAEVVNVEEVLVASFG